jgi:hypothetical protein
VAIVPITSLLTGSSTPLLASGDCLVFVDVSDTSQSVNGSTVKATQTQFFAAINVPIVITSASANALAVGLTGATNSAFKVDASTASQVAGLKVVGAATGGTVAVVVTDSGAAANLTINALGTGTIGIGSVSTGRVTITPVTTITGLLTLAAGASVTGAVAFTTDLISTTALATPSAISATQFTAFASTVSGATLMGFGTTGDVTLKNRAGTDVLVITANTLNVTLAGSLTTSGALIISGAVTGVTTLVASGMITASGFLASGGTTAALSTSAMSATSILNNATAILFAAGNTNRGMLYISETVAFGPTAQIAMSQNTSKLVFSTTDTVTFTATSGAAGSINVYSSGGNYICENKTGSTIGVKWQVLQTS